MAHHSEDPVRSCVGDADECCRVWQWACEGEQGVPVATHLFLEKPISCSCCRSSSLTLGSTCWTATNFNASIRPCESEHRLLLAMLPAAAQLLRSH